MNDYLRLIADRNALLTSARTYAEEYKKTGNIKKHELAEILYTRAFDMKKSLERAEMEV